MDVVAIVDDDGDDGVKRFTEERNNNEIRRRLSFSGSRQARDEVPKLTLFDGDANGTDQEQKEEVPEAQTESGLFGLADNFDTSLNYSHVVYSLITRIDESVLVFLIVMLICGIVYACECTACATNCWQLCCICF